MSLSVALADANVFIPRTLRDYFVYAAKAGALQIHWSQPILDEMSRNLVAKFGFHADDATELELRLTEYLPRALVEVRKRDAQLAGEVGMDAKDRHVLAAALSARADILLTQNSKHFPRAWMDERGIELLDAGSLIKLLSAEHPDELREAHRLTVANSPSQRTRSWRPWSRWSERAQRKPFGLRWLAGDDGRPTVSP